MIQHPLKCKCAEWFIVQCQDWRITANSQEMCFYKKESCEKNNYLLFGSFTTGYFNPEKRRNITSLM